MTKLMKQGGWPDTGFGRLLKKLREAKGMTGEQLADASGCHPMTISKLERGVQEPAWPLVLALCKALGVECTAFTQELPEGEEEPEKRGPGRPRKAEEQLESRRSQGADRGSSKRTDERR
jgi:transcriptional regulator with XRE-family HTH domain